MFKIALLVMTIISCAKHTPVPPPTPHMYDLSGYIGPSFETTNSPCLDGLLVNLGAACETMVQIEGAGVITELSCHKTKKKGSHWEQYTFIVIGDLSIGHPPNTHQFCRDHAAAIYFKSAHK